MSLYVFNVKPTSAIVTADTRQSIQVGERLYRLNDTTRKLYVVDDTVVTIGGVAWVGLLALGTWTIDTDHSVQRLHQIVLELIPRLDEHATALGVPPIDHSNHYLLEICALRFEPKLGYNVFYNIASYSGYGLNRFDVDGVWRPEAKMYGGIDFEIVKDYFKKHPEQVSDDYVNAVHSAYEQAASEKIGGTLLIAKQNQSHISLEERKIKDMRRVQSYSLADGTVYNIVGKGLNIECPDVNGGIAKFKMDPSGMFLFNSRYYMAADGGGKIGIDPHWGIFGGKDELFDVTDTGYVKPRFVDNDGNLILDEYGFPVYTDFMLGFRGQHYFKGVVNAVGGRFNGDVYANNFFFNDGDSVKTLLDQATKKFDLSGLDYIDLGGIQLDGVNNNINFNGAGSITWGKNAPTKKQFSVGVAGPWHDDMQGGDKWRRDWDYANETWGVPYQFKGEDGRPGTNGSDATVNFNNILKALQKAASTEETFITADELGAPNIYGGNIFGAKMYANEFNVYPLDKTEYAGAFNLFGIWSGSQYHFLKIFYGNSGFGTPEIGFDSPRGASARWSFPSTRFTGTTVDFSGTNIIWGDNHPTAVLA